MENKKIHKIGVIGVGGRGCVAESAHLPEKGFVISAGADVNQENIDKFKEKYPEAATYTDYKELLADKEIEMVFITAPDFLHEEMAIAALEAGKHIYLEKPMAISIEGCDRILATAMRTKSKLYVGHNMRHFPVVLKMKEINFKNY